MRTRVALVCASTLLLAFLLQVSFLARLGLPGATPDLVVVTLVALALAYGPLTGVLSGFGAGMLVDLAPPADGPIGFAALVYLVIGAAAGAAVDPRDRTVPVLAGIVALSAGGAVLATAALDALVGSDRVVWSEVPAVALSSAAYAVLVAPLVLLAVRWLAMKVTRDAVVG